MTMADTQHPISGSTRKASTSTLLPKAARSAPHNSTSTSSAKPFYPRWPDSNHEAEHWEIPPEHFLADHSARHLAAAGAVCAAGPSDTMNSSGSIHGRPDYSRRSSSSSSSNSSTASGRDGCLPLAELASALPFIVGPNGKSIPSRSSRSSFSTTAAAGSLSASRRPQSLFQGPSGMRTFLSSSSSNDEEGTTASYPPFAQSADPNLPDTSTLAAADFDIDVRSGFMPPEPPIERLSTADSVEVCWEDMLDRARSLPLRCGGGGRGESEEARRAAWQWRRDIRTLPVEPLSKALASDIRHARRGHLVLAFLAHFYIHSQAPAVSEAELDAELNPQTPSATPSATTTWLGALTAPWRRDDVELDSDIKHTARPPLGLEHEDDIADYKAERLGAFASTLPAAIAVPWCALSETIDLPPVLTYATTVLWNWGLVDPRKPASAPGNLRMLTTFTGTRSEEWFYATSALIELRGVEALTLMRRSLDEAFLADSLAIRRLTLYLHRLASVIADLERILAEVRSECDPAMFYFAIRPWFRAADDPRGWHYEGVDPPGVRRALTGPSAGQSSLIHALDQFLAIEHSADEQQPPPPPAISTSPSPQAPTSNATFMQRMSLYMPGHHRRFLEHLRRMNVEDSMLESQRELEQAKRRAEEELRQAAETAGSVCSAASGSASSSPASPHSPHKHHHTPAASDSRPETRPDRLAASATLHPIRRLALTPPHADADADTSFTSSLSVGSSAFEPTPLSRAYDAALYALKSLRDEHMRIATLYIITQARRGAPPEGVRSWLPGSFTGVAAAAAAAATAKGEPSPDGEKQQGEEDGGAAAAASSGAKGTGGTPLVSFLKACRANTVAAMLEEHPPASTAGGASKSAPLVRAASRRRQRQRA